MKIAGIDPKTLPPEAFLVLPRAAGNIVFRARGLSDMDEFHKLCPEPPAPAVLNADGSKTVDDTNRDYVAAMAEHKKRWWAYLVIRSLEPSNIEWDLVQLEQPSTWANWETDLLANKFTRFECNRVYQTVLEANSLDEAKLEKARALFLLGQRPESPK
jgi:hypothetical protein